MDKEQQHSSATQPAGSNQPSRERQAGQIMRQLVAEGFFDPDEAAEITFSDARFVCIPETSHAAD